MHPILSQTLRAAGQSDLFCRITAYSHRRRSWFLPRPPMYFQLLVLFTFISNVISFVILPSKVLVSTRLDPIVQPGAASSHLHNIVGGNRFNATYDPQFLRSSTCTTSPITADKSSYWAPGMYFMNKTTTSTTFTRVSSGFNIYYLPRGDSGQVKAFPDGFKMVAGDPNRNTYNSSLFEDQAISWVCLDYNNPGVNGQQTPGFPTANCPGLFIEHCSLELSLSSSSFQMEFVDRCSSHLVGTVSILILRITRTTLLTLFKTITAGTVLLLILSSWSLFSTNKYSALVAFHPMVTVYPG